MTVQTMVWCVVCIDHHDDEVVHIFSSPEKANAFCDADADRGHVVYDYVIDHPERMGQANVSN
jgi:hypothetical protein